MPRLIKYDVMKRQAAALFLCMAGLLTVAVLNILDQHSENLLRAHANSIARGWATYLVELSPDIKNSIAKRAPSTEDLKSYARGNKLNRVRSFTVFDTGGNTAFSYRPEQPERITPIQSKQGVEAGQTIVTYAGASPIVLSGSKIGSITVTVDQQRLSGIYVKAASAGAVEILVLVNLALLGCWFLYTLLTRAAKQQSTALSRHDELTGLPSRIGFVHELEAKIGLPNPLGQCAAVMVIKIDRFREINDLFGHRCADDVLRSVADRLQELSRGIGFAARLSGNTFGLFFPKVADRDDAAFWGAKVNEALGAPVTISGNRIQPKSSVGIALTPHDGTDVQTLLKRADLAQFVAHEHGGNKYRFYDSKAASDFAELHHLENTVANACDNDLFELHFQPLYRLAPQRLCGFESLVRMRDENGDYVSPEKFIPIAESLHRIEQLGTWVMINACRTAAQWPEPLSVAVNLSPAQFDNNNLVAIVREALSSSGLRPNRLELEVTEGLLIENVDSTRAQLVELQEMGIKIALDDFGTGYSSLSYLWKFPFDRIKIDRSFVASMDSSKQAAGILTTIVELARTMKLPITAEGIETVVQLEYLTKLGCNTGQGDFLGKPQSATDVAANIIVDFKQQLERGEISEAPATGKPRIRAVS